jgi:signal transduction histidine kinase
MSAGIAHELRNPLNGINLLLGLLKRAGDDKNKQLELMQKIEAAVSSLNKIITDFLVYARPSEPQRTSVVLHEVIDAAAELVRPTAQKNTVVIERDYGPVVGNVSIDRQQLQQVFLNLFLNGIEAMPRGGSLRIVTRKTDGNTVAILVEDTGHGIPEDVQAKIFDPFFTTKDSGTGLGLSIARKIVEAHAGTIMVESPVQGRQGTRFTIEIPQEGA